MNSKRALWLIIAIVLLVAGFYLYGSSNTPSDQPPLTSLNRANVEDFQQHFNSASSYTRVLLLLSPT